MKFQVNKEYILNANQEEMQKLATAVKNQITEMAKEAIESGKLIELYSNPVKAFIEVKACEWLDLLSSLCEAIGTVKWANEYDFTIEAVHNTFKKEKERYDKLDEETNYPS